jgi:hypothetical protein
LKWKGKLELLLLLGVFILAFSIRQTVCLYPPPTEWTRTYGISGNENEARSLIQTSDGGYAMLGFTKHWETGWAYTLDFWLVKTDPAGNVEWNKPYGAPTSIYLESGESLVQTDDGGYALAGYAGIYVEPIPYYDFWLVKTDPLGNMEWNQTYGGADIDMAYSVIQTNDGGYIMTGGTRSYGTGKTDFWLVKTDPLGNMEWNQTYGGADHDYAYSVIQTGDGEYAIAGFTNSYGAGDYDFWLVKADSAGNMIWNQTYGGTLADRGYAVVQTNDGGYAIAGYTGSYGAGGDDYWLVKTDSAGNVQWNQTYGGANSESAYSVVQTSDGGYALAGWTRSFAVGSHDFWLVKTDPLGNMDWNQTYGGAESDTALAWSVVQTVDGGYAISGYIHMYSIGVTDFWLIKTGSGGDVNGDGVVDILDLSVVALAYGSFEGDPDYNPEADITRDGLVDARDLAIVTLNYGIG